ncbi:MAG: hypothetical protein H6650_07850 [Ardenticatenales bacterium]|nr:hypothetical protein [Ardenticatenales bacterium]
MVQVPARIPGLRLLAIGWAIYSALWIALEGSLTRVVILAAGLSLLLAAHGLRRWGGGRRLQAWQWALLLAGLGAAVGLGAALLTLPLMALKTGLHAHGPEFGPADVVWVVRQAPWWTGAGLLAGLGLSLLTPRRAPDPD